MPARQYGVLPYRKRGNKLDLFLITCRRSGDWSVPKGWAERDLNKKQLAKLEAFEEAGLKGKLDHKLSFKYRRIRRGKMTSLELFPMEVTQKLSKWPEMKQRKRKPFSLEQALKRVRCRKLQKCLQQLAQALA